MPRLFLASNNAHKVAELRSMLATLDPPWEVGGLADLAPHIDWIEDGESFVANAKIKAQAVRQYTNACVLADDSGLVVDCLGGAPGVRSSRYAGEAANDAANNAKLLGAIAGRSTSELSARFVCTLYFLDEDGVGHEFTGALEGHLTSQPRGNSGFGYDPLFVPVVAPAGWSGCTLAELPPELKNKISHRAAAFVAFRSWLATRRF